MNYRNFLGLTTISLVVLVYIVLQAPSNSMAAQLEPEIVAENKPDTRREVRIVTTPVAAVLEEEVSDEIELPLEEPISIEAVVKTVQREKESPKVEEAVSVEENTESEISKSLPKKEKIEKETSVYKVPFFSQFADITSPQWQKVGCGIASTAMLIDFYNPGKVSVDTLLQQGITAGAFLSDAGWTHAGLINLTKQFGLKGESVSLADSSMVVAFDKLKSVLLEGPVMASVHYTFDPKNPIPHLVVVSGVKDGKVFYNDPAEKIGGGSISIAQFQSAWKKRYIEIRPS